MENHVLINVCGATRSGTTMMDLMLGNASDAFSCGEVYARFRPQQKHHVQARCRCGQDPCPVWTILKNTPESKFHAAIFRELGAKFVIDSSKELTWLIDTQNWAIHNGIHVYKLLLWKNPVDLAFSHWKRGRGVNGWRHEFVSYYSKFFSTRLPFRSINFNDLVNNPSKKLEEICGIVGMPYFDGKERFWDKQHHYLFGSHGVFEQVANKVSFIKKSQDFPSGFESLIPSLALKIAEDHEVQQILKVLQQTEVSIRGGFALGNQVQLARKPYPFWYYLRKMKQRGRQYFLLQMS